MRTNTLRSLIGVVIAAATFTVVISLVFTRAAPPGARSGGMMNLVGATQMLKVVQTEKFQTDMKFAESNTEAARMVGHQIRLGRIDGADRVIELNVREGGVIEYLLDKNGSDGKPQRVIYLPYVGDPVGSIPLEWRCYSANWSGVARVWGNCTYDAKAGDMERRHIANLRGATEKAERDAENNLAKREGERVRDDFERQRAIRLRDAERAREDEERQTARIERETEYARIELERQKRDR